MQPIAQDTAVPHRLPRQEASDDQLLDLWLHGRPPHAERAYAADADRFRAYVGPLTTATLGHIHPRWRTAGRAGVASRFRSGFLTTTQVRRLVYAAATAAGLDERPSPHWLRHAHATHALERGGPSIWFRPHFGSHHRPLPARAANRQLVSLSASLRTTTMQPKEWITRY